MAISNINIYRPEENKNFLGLNTLQTLFSTIFCIFNTFLGGMVVHDRCINIGLTFIVYAFCFGSVIW